MERANDKAVELFRSALRRVAKAAWSDRDVLRDLEYPAIVRAIGHHDGRYMVRADDPEELAARACELPGDELFVLRFVDARSDDGNLRKYRMIIAGAELCPLHLAVSKRWKVHYVTSDMEDSDENRTDFAIDRDGSPVIFEANASMFVPPVPNDPKWDYRRAPTARILDAVTRLVARASSNSTASESPSA